MKPTPFILDLGQRLAPDEFAWTILALQRDQLIWDRLTNSELGQQAAAETDSLKLTPASLALLALKNPISLKNLSDPDWVALEPELQQAADQSLKDWIENQVTSNFSLESAGLIALALHGRYVFHGNWQFLPELILDHEATAGTILTILFEITAEPDRLFGTLVDFVPDLAIHAFLCQPATLEQQLSRFSLLLEGLPDSQKNKALISLSHTRPDLAERIPHPWLVQSKEKLEPDTIETINQPGQTWTEVQAQTIDPLIQQAQVYTAVGHPELAISLYHQATAVVRQVEAYLTSKAAEGYEAMARQVDKDAPDDTIDQETNEKYHGLEATSKAVQSWELAYQLNSEKLNYAARLAWDYLVQDRVSEAIAIIEPLISTRSGEHPDQTLPFSWWIALAKLAEEHNDTQQAVVFLGKAIKLLPVAPGEVDLLLPAATLSLRSGIPDLALHLAEAAYRAKPVDLDLLHLLIKSHLILSQPAEAYGFASLAQALFPGPEHQRMVITCLEASDAWSAALDQHQQLIEALDPVESGDYRRLAACAVQAGQIEIALNACRHALEQDNQDGLTIEILGEIALSEGNRPEAIEYFTQATQLSPENEKAWLYLARLYHDSSETEQCLEILQKASQAVPDSVNIHLQLGEALLRESLPAQALTPLRQATNLVFKTNRPVENLQTESKLRITVANTYATTLRKLGYMAESRQVFELACNTLPNNDPCDPAFSYSYAQTLLGMQAVLSAIPWLERATTQSYNPSANLDLARALLDTSTDSENAAYAIRLLQNILTPPEQHTGTTEEHTLLNRDLIPEAYALLAEALRRTNDLTGAMEAYRVAIDSPLIQQPQWRYKLPLGLGQAALALGQNEAAIAALLEASQAEPEHVEIYQNLFTAYSSINLPVDAFQAAYQVARIDCNNPNAQLWFAEQSLHLFEKPGAKDLPVLESARAALERAAILSPERADIKVRLAEYFAQYGEKADAVAVLDSLSGQPEAEIILRVIDLQNGARILLNIGEPGRAAALLEQAIRLNQSDPASEAHLTPALLYSQLSRAYQLDKQHTASLEAIDQAILLQAEQSEFHVQKSEIFLDRGDLSQAAESLQIAEKCSPSDWIISCKNSLVAYAQGEILCALKQMRLSLEQLPAARVQAENHAAMAWLAGEMAHHLLMNDEIQDIQLSGDDVQPIFESACLQAELALENDDQQGAVEQASMALASIIELSPRHPRILALQARFIGRQEGISETSLQLFDSALAAVNKDSAIARKKLVVTLPELSHTFYQRQINHLARVATLQGVSEAALELKQWSALEPLCEKAIQLAPCSAAIHLQYVRTLILRAEWQRLCRALEIVAHAPGAIALSAAALNGFERMLLKCAENIDLSNNDAVRQVTRWRVRGNAVFFPDESNYAGLCQFAEKGNLIAEDIAALVWIAGILDRPEEAKSWAAHSPNHPLVNSALALAIYGSESDRAIHLLQQALVRLAEPDLKMPDALPMLQALIAQISEKSATNDSDRQLALSSIQDALTIWANEPRWHDLAARILLLQVDEKSITDQDPVLEHLEQAAQLEPGLAEHHLKLGHYYIVHNELERAIQAVETATKVDPENPDAWLILAGLQKESGELEKATYSAERALAFASQSLDALLLRSQLALLTNNPRGALSRAQTILNITPDQAEAWFILAQALDMLEKPADALVAVQKAILMTDDSLEYQHYRIDLLHRMNGAQTAIREIEQLSGAFPEDPLLLSLAANYYLELNDSVNAQKTARLALQFGQQELPENTQAQLHFIIGAQSRQAGQLDQAIYHLNEALRKNPEMMSAYLELGRAYQDRRQVNLALEIYQHAARIMPNDYRPYYQAGLAHRESKDYLEAETMFRRAAHLAPNEVSIHRQLAAVVALNLVHNRRLASPE